MGGELSYPTRMVPEQSGRGVVSVLFVSRPGEHSGARQCRSGLVRVVAVDQGEVGIESAWARRDPSEATPVL